MKKGTILQTLSVHTQQFLQPWVNQGGVLQAFFRIFSYRQGDRKQTKQKLAEFSHIKLPELNTGQHQISSSLLPNLKHWVYAGNSTATVK